MVADSEPIEVGIKVTVSEQVAFAAKVEVQVPPVMLKSPAFGPLKPSLSETDLFCLLLTLIDLTDFIPSLILPIETLAGVTVISTVPVPLAATCCGLVAVLS
jgi:hypothetical protein